MMKRSVLYNIGIVILLVMTGCEHRPLVDLNSNHYIRVYIDEQIKNVTYGFYDESREKPEYNQPNVIRVALHHPETDQVVATMKASDKSFTIRLEPERRCKLLLVEPVK